MPARRSDIAESIGLLILRIAVGGMMLTHGWPKVGSCLKHQSNFPIPLELDRRSPWLAVFAEVLCAALLVIGLATRLAAVPFLITMIVAALIVHGDDPFSKQELALFYGAERSHFCLLGLVPSVLTRGFWVEASPKQTDPTPLDVHERFAQQWNIAELLHLLRVTMSLRALRTTEQTPDVSDYPSILVAASWLHR